MVSVLVSRELWEGREVRLLYSIGNCLLHSKDFSTAVRVFEQLVEKDKHDKSSLLGGIGRIYLQVKNCYYIRTIYVSNHIMVMDERHVN